MKKHTRHEIVLNDKELLQAIYQYVSIQSMGKIVIPEEAYVESWDHDARVWLNEPKIQVKWFVDDIEAMEND